MSKNTPKTRPVFNAQEMRNIRESLADDLRKSRSASVRAAAKDALALLDHTNDREIIQGACDAVVDALELHYNV